MEVFIHLADVDFSSRCALQDCYVLPARSHPAAASAEGAAVEVVGDKGGVRAGAGALPEAVLVSPYFLHRHTAHRSPRPLALLWRCGACGKEQPVAREALSLFSHRGGHGGRKGAPLGAASRRHEPAACPGCYACPRCNAPALSISISRQLLYVACCSYCHWRHGDACEELEGLLASLSAVTASNSMPPCHRAAAEWRRSSGGEREAHGEASSSLSRSANSEFTGAAVAVGGAAPRHAAVALEELRNAICERALKSAGSPPGRGPLRRAVRNRHGVA
ncbi:uncharacterized protein Tco025E_07963 [Trypanosoma conorhini]|uniref:Uncharacterized protein n=1 Tax=Trypanosoma conorhini TaxID=83891 RepID=A0A3R7LW80_9TRYP|nr:uncharacterized protein Tco025E_07963 [Trypanosoma conorhini]RNF04556.1 hypothetical protein Tco025E_07963 [Trypanosoma conorhini]